MARTTPEPADDPEAARPPAPELKYTLVLANIPLGPFNPGQLAWIEESQAAEFIAVGFASKVLRKDAGDAPPGP